MAAKNDRDRSNMLLRSCKMNLTIASVFFYYTIHLRRGNVLLVIVKVCFCVFKKCILVFHNLRSIFVGIYLC